VRNHGSSFFGAGDARSFRLRAVAAALIALSCGCATFHGGGYSCTDPVNPCINPVTAAIAVLIIAADQGEAPLGPLCDEKADPSPVSTCPPNRERSAPSR
jgi:hypothetical protein